MKIYDCFPFYNELDLLELRLTELYDHVDHFVLVESNTTFTSRPKPFYFEENRERYSKWLDKIIHIKVEDMPGDPDAWVNDVFQRNQIIRGLDNVDMDDLVIVSDLDEIIRPAAIEHMRASDSTVFALRMPLFNFKFNYMKLKPCRYDVWAMAGRRSIFLDILPDAFRQLRFRFFDCPYQMKENGFEVVEHGGWHFGYMGDKEWLLDKAQSFAHQEINTPEFLAQIDPEASIAKRTCWLQDSDERYEIVELDAYFPQTVTSNPEKYKQYILDNPAAMALALLPEYPYNT